MCKYFGGALYVNMWTLVIQATHSPKNFENIEVWITEGYFGVIKILWICIAVRLPKLSPPISLFITKFQQKYTA